MAVKDKREQLKETIISKATTLFFENGIKAVTMDTISKSMKISKRTLYEVYENKLDLLYDVLLVQRNRTISHMEEFAKQNPNTMDILIEFFRKQSEFYSSTHPDFLRDIMRYPELMEKSQMHNNSLNNRSEIFFNKGIAEGYFLPTVNYQFLMDVTRLSLKEMRTSSEFKDVGHEVVFKSFICVIIRGVCTVKGLERLDAFLNELMN